MLIAWSISSAPILIAAPLDSIVTAPLASKSKVVPSILNVPAISVLSRFVVPLTSMSASRSILPAI